MELIMEIMKICVVPLLGILTKYIIDFLNAKSNELKNKTKDEVAKKYIDMINNTVTKCVIATNQTFVDAIKNSNEEFTAEKQQEAFYKTMNSVMGILTDDAKNYISETTGDLKLYLTQLIEAEVKKQK